jgi:antitoxin component YwqK of YwqJK toxin-antitoxin module
MTETCDNNNYSGVDRTYYDTEKTQLKLEVFMMNGKEEGIRNEYNHLGLIYRTSECVNGKLHGKQITYNYIDNIDNIDNIPTMEYIFVNDDKIEEKHFHPRTGKVIEHYKYKYYKLNNRTYIERISIEL